MLAFSCKLCKGNLGVYLVIAIFPFYFVPFITIVCVSILKCTVVSTVSCNAIIVFRHFFIHNVFAEIFSTEHWVACLASEVNFNIFLHFTKLSILHLTAFYSMTSFRKFTFGKIDIASED